MCTTRVGYPVTVDRFFDLSIDELVQKLQGLNPNWAKDSARSSRGINALASDISDGAAEPTSLTIVLGDRLPIALDRYGLLPKG